MTTVKLVLVVGSIRISDLHHCDGSGSALIAHGFRPTRYNANFIAQIHKLCY
jgi:hypothetical protein